MVEDDERTSAIDGFWGDDVAGGGAGDATRDRDAGPPNARRQWIVLGAAFVVFVVCAIIAFVAVRASFAEDTEGNPVEWRDATQDGSSVTVTWDASPCANEGTTTVEETSDAVVITVREIPRQALCSSPGEVRTTTVELDDAVGERQLVDGSID